MVGQHIFVRCKNEQNNAGTWTAAITDNIVEKEVVRNLIEPRCNMDEAFAQRTMLSCTDNNVLRIYHVGEDTTVVSRTYWVTDRITESKGRKGAYSTSYILTDKDVVRFFGDFDGAFDTDCFESYDSLVERTGQGYITLNDQMDLFKHRDGAYDPSIFASAGFKKETFVSLMEGVYSAMANKKQLVVVLPEVLRRAWEESGDKTAEKLAYQVLSLLPDFTRMHLGVATHWSCQIKDKMVSDMHLIFVHPEREEELAQLKREGTMILDVDTGKYTANISQKAPLYFSFLWDSLQKKDVIDAFWEAAKDNYRKLLRGRPVRALVMESIYSMYATLNEKFTNKDRLRYAYLLTAKEFAGAGTRVPAAEVFLYDAFNALKPEELSSDSELENAVCTMMREDPMPTKHQVQEYSYLLSQCDSGKASVETVEELCNELIKEERESESYFLPYFLDKKDLEADQITQQMLLFCSGACIRLIDRGISPILRAATTTLCCWGNALLNAGKWEKLSPIAEAYRTFLRKNGINAELKSSAYSFLFRYEHHASSEERDECIKALFREEGKLYASYGNSEADAAEFRLYANSFFESLPAVEFLKKEMADTCYQRLFRLAYFGDKEIRDAVISLYEKIITNAKEANAISRVSDVLLVCSENALEQIQGAPGEWNRKKVGNIFLTIELLNFSLLPQYVPTRDRISKFVKWYDRADERTYMALSFYLKKLEFGDRQTMYVVLKENGLLENLFTTSICLGRCSDLHKEIETALGLRHEEELRIFFKPEFPQHLSLAENDTKQRFAEWYLHALEEELKNTTVASRISFADQYSTVLKEYRLLQKHAATSETYVQIASGILDARACMVFGTATSEQIALLPSQDIADIVKIIEGFSADKPETEKDFIWFHALDNAVKKWKVSDIEKLLESAREKGTAHTARRRFEIYREKAPTREVGWMLAMYNILLTAQLNMPFPLDDFLVVIDKKSQERVRTGIFLFDFLHLLRSYGSKFEQYIGHTVMQYLCERIEHSPQDYDNREFWVRCWNARQTSYYKQSYIEHYRQRYAINSKLHFGTPMFLWCLVEALLICGVAVLLMSLLVTLGRISAIVSITVGVFIAIILVILCVLVRPLSARSVRNKKHRRTY